jgi:DNA-binding response OmpR family regulator
MQILIADTDPELLQLVGKYLRKRGHEVEIASNGVECYVRLQRFFQPDVLILAHDLPWGGCDGVLAEMRADAALSQIPTILITDSDDECNTLASPAVMARIRKPFSLSQLLERIESASCTMQIQK